MSDSISRAAVQKRLDDLQKEHAQLLGNFNAVEGAIQLCKLLLADMDKAEAPKRGRKPRLGMSLTSAGEAPAEQAGAAVAS